jgi:hypothetical protein
MQYKFVSETKKPTTDLETGWGTSHKAPPMVEKEKAMIKAGYRFGVGMIILIIFLLPLPEY